MHAHAYALALKKLTGVELEKFLPTPNIPLGKIPECQNVKSRVRTGAYTRSAPLTIRSWPKSGVVMARPRYRTIRRVTLKSSRELLDGGKNPQLNRRTFRLHTGLCARRDVRDCQQALRKVAVKATRGSDTAGGLSAASALAGEPPVLAWSVADAMPVTVSTKRERRLRRHAPSEGTIEAGKGWRSILHCSILSAWG